MVLFGLGLFWPWFTQAQESSVADLTELSIEDLSQIHLSTASRHLEDPRKAPTAITVITRQEIRQYGWRTLSDLLRSVTGFYTAYDRTYTYVGVRGFLQSGDYNARILLLIDGHRINDNIFDGALVGTEFPLDMNLIDRVEVARGPGSSLFGTNAELAVVNVFTRRPDYQTSLEVTLGGDSFHGRTGEIRTSMRTARWATLLSGSIYRSNGRDTLYFPEYDSPDTNHGVARNLDGDRYDHAFGMIRRGQFRLEGLFGTRDKIVPNASYQTIFGDPDNRSKDTVGYMDASYSHDFSASAQMDVRAYYDGYRYKGIFPYTKEDGTGRAVQVNDAAADGIGVEAVLGRRLGRHRIVGGLAGEHNFRINQRNYYVGQPPFLDDRRKLDHAAAFGEAELNPTGKFSFNVGGRLDFYNLYGTALSPRVAAMYFPAASTSLKYIFSHAFRAPDPYDEFYVDQVDITATNQSLKPEDINTHTALVEHEFSPSLHMAASGFWNSLNHVIKEELDPLTGATQFANETGDTGNGAEFEWIANYRSGWRARASYTFEQTRQKQWGTTVMNSPSHLAKINGVAPLQKMADVGAELLVTGPQPNYLGQRIPSSFLVNATLSTRPFARGFEFSASGYNLLDRAWSTPTGPEISAPATAQDGRTWRIRLTYRATFERRAGSNDRSRPQLPIPVAPPALASAGERGSIHLALSGLAACAAGRTRRSGRIRIQSYKIRFLARDARPSGHRSHRSRRPRSGS
jgi:outer membrane receptor for ferrienterochelin and colicins